MQEKEEITIYDVITKKKQMTRKADTKLIMKAYNFANEHHKDQKRVMNMFIIPMKTELLRLYLRTEPIRRPSV